MTITKTLLATLLFTFLQTSAALAQNVTNQDVNTIQLTYGIKVPTKNPANSPRIPAANVRVCNQANTLLLYGAFSEYTLQILDFDEDIIFQTELFGEDYIELPEYLSGLYIIRFVYGNQYFEGHIEI